MWTWHVNMPSASVGMGYNPLFRQTNGLPMTAAEYEWTTLLDTSTLNR